MLRCKVFGIAAALVTAVAAGSANQPAAAQATDNLAPACTAANARPMTIAAITAMGDAAVDTCVSVEGLAVAGRIYADNAARYRQHLRHNDPSSTGAILGLYGNSLPGEARARARVIGWVDSCDRALERAVAASGPENIVMMGGYCHYFSGLTIHATSVTALGEANQVRILRRDADPALGDLAQMAPGVARDLLLVAANRLFAALGTPDVARALLGRSNGAARSDAEISAMADRLAANAGTRTGAGVTEIFGWRVPAYARAEERRGYDEQTARVTEGIACHSTRPQPAALWPISEGDAMLGGQRPYACVRINIGADGIVSFDMFGSADEDYGIREP